MGLWTEISFKKKTSLENNLLDQWKKLRSYTHSKEG